MIYVFLEFYVFAAKLRDCRLANCRTDLPLDNKEPSEPTARLNKDTYFPENSPLNKSSTNEICLFSFQQTV
eukprot:UN13090